MEEIQETKELENREQKQFSEEELKILEKYKEIKNKNLKQGMIEKAKQGNFVSRAPFGYIWDNKNLVPAENYREVEEIFEEFLQQEMNLRKLSRKHNFSVNGIKKILSNFAYIGKLKFNGEIHQGHHQPLISTTLFNHVQNKLNKITSKTIGE